MSANNVAQPTDLYQRPDIVAYNKCVPPEFQMRPMDPSNPKDAKIIAKQQEANRKAENSSTAMAQRFLKQVYQASGHAELERELQNQGLLFHPKAAPDAPFNPGLTTLPSLIYWQEEWLQYDHGVWRRIGDSELRTRVITFLKQATMADTPEVAPSRTTAVIEAMREALVSETEQLPLWLDKDKDMRWYATHPNLISFANGLLDRDELLAGDAEIFDHTPQWLSLTMLPYDYDPAAECPLWLQTLAELLPREGKGDHRIDVLQEFFGWCLVDDLRLEKFLMLVGEGGNGKSTILDVLGEMLGHDNCSHLSLLNVGKDSMRLSMQDKLVNISSDMSRVSKTDEGILKMLISGDLIATDRKFKSAIMMKPTAKLVFACNELPGIADRSNGLWRRAIFMPLNVSFDAETAEKDRAERIIRNELSGIFNWAIEGLRRLYRHQKFTDCEVCAARVEEHRLESDPVMQFYQEKCEIEEGTTWPAEGVYNEFRTFCEQRGCIPMNSTHFGRRFLKMPGVGRVRQTELGRRRYFYQGFRLVAGLAGGPIVGRKFDQRPSNR